MYAIGLWLGLPDTTCAEICAAAGFDWLVIDTEHGPFDLPAVLGHLRTLAAYDVQAVVRPVSDDRNVLKQLLDTGVQTLVVPWSNRLSRQGNWSGRCATRRTGYAAWEGLARGARWHGIPGYCTRRMTRSA